MEKESEPMNKQQKIALSSVVNPSGYDAGAPVCVLHKNGCSLPASSHTSTFSLM